MKATITIGRISNNPEVVETVEFNGPQKEFLETCDRLERKYFLITAPAWSGYCSWNHDRDLQLKTHVTEYDNI